MTLGRRCGWGSALTIAACALGPATVGACTVCDSDTSREVRGRLLDDELAVNVLAAALPFLTVGAVVTAVHFGLPGSWNGRRDGHPRR
jgi:hypothetical protein